MVFDKKKLIIWFIFFGLFLYIAFPFKSVASNCCEITSNIVGNNGVTSNFSSCNDDASVTKESCVSKTTSIFSSTNNQTAVFFENSMCKDNKCVTGDKVTPTTTEVKLRPLNFKFNIPLPGMPSSFKIDIVNPTVLSDYITWLFKFTIGVAGLLAVFMITVGGLMWVFAGGNGSKLGKAKEYITGAVIGLLLAVFSYSILYIINPQLILNKFPSLNRINFATIDGFKGNPSLLGRKGQECFLKEFGSSEAEVRKNLETIECPFLKSGQLIVHKKVAQAFKSACDKIPAGTKTVCGTTPVNGGTQVWRNIAGSSSLSLHSWGVALDISPQDCTVAADKSFVEQGIYKVGNLPADYKVNPSAKGKANLPSVVTDAFKSSGFVWGGDWPASNPVDNMHFETYGPCAIKKKGGASGSGGVGGQCSGSIISIPGGKPTLIKSLTSSWVTRNSNGDVYHFQTYNNTTGHDTDLIIYFHGILSSWNTFDSNCKAVQLEVDEVGSSKYGLACIHGKPDGNPWSSDVVNETTKINEAINKFKQETGRSPAKVIVAGHSNAYAAMNQLIGSSVDSKINKYVWLDACYANPGSSSKVVGIEVTTAEKTNAPCKCSSIENRYDAGVGHMEAINYLSDYLKKL